MSLYEDLLVKEVMQDEEEGALTVEEDFSTTNENEIPPPRGSNQLGAKDIYTERLGYIKEHTYTSHYTDIFSAIKSGSNLVSESYKPNGISFHHPLFRYYGKMDDNGDFITPKTNKLQQITVADRQYFAFNFVAEAFGDFVKYINEDKKNVLGDSSFMKGSIQAKRAYQNFDNFYANMFSGLYSGYALSFLNDPKEDRKVINYKSFLDSFFNRYYAEMSKSMPITKAGLLQSNLLGPNSTGLCVEIATDDHSSDFEKYQKFISDTDFTFYQLAAGKFGFLVDDNAPWRLVANLNSPKMKEYISKNFFKGSPIDGVVDLTKNLDHYHGAFMDANGNGVTSAPIKLGNVPDIPFHQHKIANMNVQPSQAYGDEPLAAHVHDLKLLTAKDNFTDEEFYNEFFYKPHLTELDSFRQNIIRLYQRLVSEKPTVKVLRTCVRSTTGYVSTGSNFYTKSRHVRRETLPNGAPAGNNLYWLKVYFFTRILEASGGDIKYKAKIKKALDQINKMYYFLDNESVTLYINDYIKQNY